MTIADRIERLGAHTIDGIRAGFELIEVAFATFRGAIHSSERPKGEIVNQMFIIGNKSLLFVTVTLGFIGMVMVYQACLQLNRITGDLSQVGPQVIKLLIQDLAPTITAMMLATRVGAGIAAEIGSMKVTEQIDALRMSGVTPIDHLLVPRFVASVIMSTVLTVYAVIVAAAMGGLTAAVSFNVNPHVFFDLSRIMPFDLVMGLTKTVCYAIAIPIIAGFCGLRAQGSSEGVGWATTAAVVGGSLAVIFIDFVISGTGLIFFSGGMF